MAYDSPCLFLSSRRIEERLDEFTEKGAVIAYSESASSTHVATYAGAIILIQALEG